MRTSPLRHPVAILRNIIGIGQKELAALCDCSARAIQSVELCSLKLSAGLAAKIERATGADVGWLLNGDPRVRPVLSRSTFGSLSSPANVPYSKVQYDIWRSKVAELERGRAGATEGLVPYTEVAAIHAILVSAIASGRESLARYRITQFEKGAPGGVRHGRTGAAGFVDPDGRAASARRRAFRQSASRYAQEALEMEQGEAPAESGRADQDGP